MLILALLLCTWSHHHFLQVWWSWDNFSLHPLNHETNDEKNKQILFTDTRKVYKQNPSDNTPASWNALKRLCKWTYMWSLGHAYGTAQATRYPSHVHYTSYSNHFQQPIPMARSSVIGFFLYTPWMCTRGPATIPVIPMCIHNQVDFLVSN